MPLYVLLNKAPFAIQVQEDSRPGDPWLTIESDECVPFWPKSVVGNTMHVKAKDSETISRTFKYGTVQCSLLKLKNRVNKFLFRNLMW